MKQRVNQLHTSISGLWVGRSDHRDSTPNRKGVVIGDIFAWRPKDMGFREVPVVFSIFPTRRRSENKLRLNKNLGRMGLVSIGKF